MRYFSQVLAILHPFVWFSLLKKRVVGQRLVKTVHKVPKNYFDLSLCLSLYN